MSGRPLRALLVEDFESDALLLVRGLRRVGFDVTFERVDTAEAMAAALASGGWDVVISDFALPRFSAPRALAMVRERGLDLPCLVVSGVVSESLAAEAARAGARGVIVKGDVAGLIQAIEAALA